MRKSKKRRREKRFRTRKGGCRFRPKYRNQSILAGGDSTARKPVNSQLATADLARVSLRAPEILALTAEEAGETRFGRKRMRNLPPTEKKVGERNQNRLAIKYQDQNQP